jgi:hypothetical protein
MDGERALWKMLMTFLTGIICILDIFHAGDKGSNRRQGAGDKGSTGDKGSKGVFIGGHRNCDRLAKQAKDLLTKRPVFLVLCFSKVRTSHLEAGSPAQDTRTSALESHMR